jgi:hypothetical protein
LLRRWRCVEYQVRKNKIIKLVILYSGAGVRVEVSSLRNYKNGNKS